MNTSIEITAEAEREAASVDQILAYANSFMIVTHGDYEKGAEALRRIKAKAKNIDDLRKTLTRPIDETKARIMAFFRGPSDRLGEAERTIKARMVEYQDEQDRKRREEERKAEELARKERERMEREAAKEAEKARIEAEKAAAKAAALEAAGKTERAEALRMAAAEREQARMADVYAKQDEAATIIAPVINMPRAEAAGTSVREVWKFEVLDEDQIPREFMVYDEKKIRAHVQSMRGRSSIPGVRVYSEKQIAARSA